MKKFLKSTVLFLALAIGLSSCMVYGRVMATGITAAITGIITTGIIAAKQSLSMAGKAATAGAAFLLRNALIPNIAV